MSALLTKCNQALISNFEFSASRLKCETPSYIIQVHATAIQKQWRCSHLSLMPTFLHFLHVSLLLMHIWTVCTVFALQSPPPLDINSLTCSSFLELVFWPHKECVVSLFSAALLWSSVIVCLRACPHLVHMSYCLASERSVACCCMLCNVLLSNVHFSISFYQAVVIDPNVFWVLREMMQCTKCGKECQINFTEN